MSHKVFISYSHKDETFKENFEEHLSTLKRKNIISVWHDRDINAGDHWKREIDENLKTSSIIIFLVSPSFIASNYCYEIEFQQAKKNEEKGKCKIIPVIIRPCSWEDLPLSNYQAVPKDALPISKWDNQDEAWLDSIDKIQTIASNFQFSISTRNTNSQNLEISSDFHQWLKDTELKFSHRNVDQVDLDDLFIIPDIQYNDLDNEDIIYRNSTKLIENKGLYLISGDEQQGKTSLLKFFFLKLSCEGSLPLYLDAAKIKTSKINNLIKDALSTQYSFLSLNDFLDTEKNTVILIDNIDKINLNSKFRGQFLENLNKEFSHICITCDSTFSYIHREISALNDYEEVCLLDFGHKNREELVKKWVSLGQEESISDLDLYSQCDEIKERLNILIKRNIVPSKPIYVLMFLQMFETNTQLNLELTSYGHCYQQLIYQAFDNAKIAKRDYEKYLNILSEFSWWVFTHNKSPNDIELNSFFEKYNNHFLPVDNKKIISKLENNSILQKTDGETGFKYPYIYFFFVGKKIAENYHESDTIREHIKLILENIHREDFANILIFVTHHTKDSWILNEVQSVMASFFNEQDAATLKKEQLHFMDEFMKSIPELVLEQREIQDERVRHNQKLDEIERIHDDDPEEINSILVDINQTFKGMEVAGQIIRNRHASIKTDSLIDLASSGIYSGLRFLEYFIKIQDTAKQEVIRIIAHHISVQPNISDEKIEKDAETVYMHLIYNVINGVIRKIGSAIGSKDALMIYKILDEDSGTPAISLIKQSIELQFNKSLNIRNITECVEKLKNNSVCLRILKEMVIQHIYMFPVEYKEKQQLSSLLGISVKQQRIMEIQRAGKG